MSKRTSCYWLGTVLCYLLLTSSSSLSGCRSNRAAADGPPRPATDARSSAFLLKKLEQRASEITPAQSLIARAKITLEGDGQTISVNANLVWLRDSVLWINVKKFGLEAARALVTRDSAFVLNRLEKTCTVQSLASLQRQYSLPGEADFGLITQVLFGQATLLKGLELKSDTLAGRHRLLGSDGRFTADYRVEEGSFLLKNENFLQQKDNRAVSLAFDSHQKVAGLPALFAYLREVETYSPADGQQRVTIEFSDVQINTQPTYRFEIPNHYTRN